jgi:hypothetical protein
VTDVVGPGTLKLVIAASPSRSLDPIVARMLEARADANDVRRMAEAAYAVHTTAEPEEVRAWIVAGLRDYESVFVVEFERWSSHGAGIDREWLLRRGH